MGAIISECGKYRYRLSRLVNTAGIGENRRILFVMLNPSTADASLDDPTIRKCMGFAQRQFHGILEVVNLFAFRSTDPKELKKAHDPVGAQNKSHILRAAADSDMIICAWGTNCNQKPLCGKRWGQHSKTITSTNSPIKTLIISSR